MSRSFIFYSYSFRIYNYFALEQNATVLSFIKNVAFLLRDPIVEKVVQKENNTNNMINNLQHALRKNGKYTQNHHQRVLRVFLLFSLPKTIEFLLNAVVKMFRVRVHPIQFTFMEADIRAIEMRTIA